MLECNFCIAIRLPVDQAYAYGWVAGFCDGKGKRENISVFCDKHQKQVTTLIARLNEEMHKRNPNA